MSLREPRAIRIVEDRWTTFRHVVEAVAIVAAGLWAFYTFVYQERIKPAGEPAALTVSIDVSRLGRDAKRDILNVTVGLKNAGKTEIDIAALAYDVWGERYAPRETVSVLDQSNYRVYTRELPIASKILVSSFADLRDATVGGRTGSHIIIEPGSTQITGDVIAVPRGAYDLMHARVIAVPVKTSITARVHVSIVRQRSGEYSLAIHDKTVYEDDVTSDFSMIP